jgi:hypothetical protein
MLKLSTSLITLVFVASSLAIASLAIASIRVDINLNQDRRDILTADGENWSIPDGVEAARNFGNVEIIVRASGKDGATLKGEWWKAGYDHGATLASDGVVASDGASIDIVLRGLSAGRHRLVTRHNLFSPGLAARYELLVDGKPIGQTVQPTTVVTSDEDAAIGNLVLDARPDRDVTVTIRRIDGGPVVLNGFELDTADPLRRAIKPSPQDRDEHVAENPVLRWSSRTPARAYRVFLGTTRDVVAAATTDSREFLGETTGTEMPTKDLTHRPDYFWRVDFVAEDGSVTTGDVWRFRVRRLAFPGAEGYGRFARGGRGGRVIAVTNLNDSGPGSLREAVEAEGPRTVVFKVGGTIQLKSKLVIRNPYITIAGQTAPGDGICIRGYTFGFYGTHDAIIRYVRIRVGDESGQTMDGTGFASSDHCIIDHCSVSWSIDEAVSSRGAGNITFSRNIVAEPLNIAHHAKYQPGKGHGYAGSISGNIGSFHHNLLAHAAGRNFSLAGGLTRGGNFAGLLDIRNNVVFNWVNRTNDGGVKGCNLVANYYIPGPATRVFHLLKPDVGNPDDPQQYHVSGNIIEGRDHFADDNWHPECVVVDPKHLPLIRRDHPIFEPFVTTHDAKQAYESVMADVGANLPKLDAVDQRILDEVRRRTFTFRGSRSQLPGIPDSQTDVGGWPELAPGIAPIDSDHDGMPDTWEVANALNPRDPSDATTDADNDGWENLEEYLQWIIDNRGKLQP